VPGNKRKRKGRKTFEPELSKTSQGREKRIRESTLWKKGGRSAREN